MVLRLLVVVPIAHLVDTQYIHLLAMEHLAQIAILVVQIHFQSIK
jgi:hypothetical protein